MSPGRQSARGQPAERRACRYSAEPRCERCGLRRSQCVCEQVPALRLPWDLWVVRHRRERHKPSNTGRLLVHAVENARLLEHADRERSLKAEDFSVPGRRLRVLFPAPDARVLDRPFLESCLAEPTTFVILDGTWRQAGRMSRRIPGLCTLPRVALPLEEPSRWITRRARQPDRLCTLEAVWRLSRLAGDRASADGLERMLRSLLAGQRASRAEARNLPPEVAETLPADAALREPGAEG